jgi:hypothetical protein
LDHHQTSNPLALERGNFPDFSHLVDVFLNLFEHFPLILQANIGVALCLDFLARQEPIGSNSVVECDGHNIVARSSNEARAISAKIRIVVEPSSLDKYIDWF